MRPQELKRGELRRSELYPSLQQERHGTSQFVDPEDQETYVYTDLEPFHAHEVFPCFDQPDLKAHFELTVEVPQEWEVISATPESEVNKVDGRRSWAFPPSPLLSTYVFP